ncbi:Uncharacterized protein SCF082_LOCUS37357, partial [Durusdinium trenchii]
TNQDIVTCFRRPFSWFAHMLQDSDQLSGSEEVQEAPRSRSPAGVRQRLLQASRSNSTVWYFEVHLGGALESVAQQLPPGRPHLRAARECFCELLNAAGAAVAWPRPGLLCVHLLVPEETETSEGSSWSHWLVKCHLRGDLAVAAKASLRTAPKGFDSLEVEHVSTPLPVKDFWLDASETVNDLGVELSGAALQEAAISKSVMGGFVWSHGLQTRDLLLWIDGRPSAEMSPEEVSAELRGTRPLRLCFVRPGLPSRSLARSPAASADVNEHIDQELEDLRSRRLHLQQLQQKLLEAQSQQLQAAKEAKALALRKATGTSGGTASLPASLPETGVLMVSASGAAQAMP